MPGLGAIPPARRGRARDRWGVSSRRARRRCAGHGARCPAPSLRLPGKRSDLQSQPDPTVAWGQWRQSRRPLGAGSPPGEPPGRGHHAVAPPLWRLSRHRGEPWISALSWWQHDRAATVLRRDRRGRCAGIAPLGDEVAAERVARCQPLATPASDGQGAPVRFARVRFAASRFARARPPGRACGSGAQLRPQPGHRGAVAAQASPRRALSGEGSVRGQNSERDLPGPAPRPSTEFPAARGGEGMERGAVCPQRRRVHGGQDDVPARPQGV